MGIIPNGSREQYRAREQAFDPQRNRLLTRAVLFTRPLRNGRISTRHATGASSRRRIRTADSAPIQAYGIRPCIRTETAGRKREHHGRAGGSDFNEFFEGERDFATSDLIAGALRHWRSGGCGL